MPRCPLPGPGAGPASASAAVSAFTRADPKSGSGTASRDTILGVCKSTAIQRQAPATDAVGEPGLEALQLVDPLIDPLPPTAGKAGPVAARRYTIGRQPCQLATDLLERQSDPLGEDDEGDPPGRRTRVAAVAGARALGGDQPALLVVAQGPLGVGRGQRREGRGGLRRPAGGGRAGPGQRAAQLRAGDTARQDERARTLVFWRGKLLVSRGASPNSAVNSPVARASGNRR